MGTVFSLISTWALWNVFWKLQWVLLNGAHLIIWWFTRIQTKSLKGKVIFLYYTPFFTQHFYKQRQAEIDNMLSNILMQNFCYLKNIHILHPRYQLNIIGHTVFWKKAKWQAWTIIMKMKIQMKNKSHGSHRYDMNSPWTRHGNKYSE